MSYEYNSGTANLEFPNPYRIENLARFVKAGIVIVAGLVLLFVSRENIMAKDMLAILPLLVGVGLVLYGLTNAAIGMSQLRFFFGRGEPASLAKEESPASGASNDASRSHKYSASDLTEMIRQNAIVLPEPKGALNGLLYSWMPNLMFAPARIQNLAQIYFQNTAILLAVLFSFLVSIISISDPVSRFLAGAVFIVVTLVFTGAGRRSPDEVKPLEPLQLVGLILMALFIPVAFPMLGKFNPSRVDLGWAWLSTLCFILLLVSIAASAIFIFALRAQIDPPPATGNASDTRTVSINAHPKQITDELDRVLQASWELKTPNRVYISNAPTIPNTQTGTFAGEFLQETQPFANAAIPKLTVAEVLNNPRHKFLAYLNAFGVLLTLAGAICALVFGIGFSGGNPNLVYLNLLGASILLLLAANHCTSAAGRLWGRFDFKSKLFWIEMSGNFQQSSVDYGNQFTDKIKSSKRVVNIETMTLRVWVTEIHSVCFKKSDIRHVVSMRGEAQQARTLAQHLCDFGAEQSIFIAPTAQTDVGRLATLGAANQFGGTGVSPVLAIAQAAGQVQAQAEQAAAAEQARAQTEQAIAETRAASVQEVPLKGKVCPVCSTVAESSHAFCAECGHKFELA